MNISHDLSSKSCSTIFRARITPLQKPCGSAIKSRFSAFFIKNRPIITKVRNSTPTKYSDGAVVKNSLIADGCVVEGTVENSILFRGVKVGKNTVVKNSILFKDVYTGENVVLNCVVADKNVVIRDNKVLSGHETMPFYIPRDKMI